MPEQSVVEIPSLNQRTEPRRGAQGLWLWAMFCFWVMPGLGLALTMIAGFQRMEAGEERVPSLIEQILAYSWLALPAIGLAVFGVVVLRQSRVDDAEAADTGL